MARIFLCHAKEDTTQVREVYQQLKAIEGFEPWLDEEDLLPGQDWDREIRRALHASDFILIVLSRNSVEKRSSVQREMKMALVVLQELPEGTIHTIPVRLDDCDVPEQFQRYQYADLFDPRGFERLVRSIQAGLAQRPQTTAEPPPVPSGPQRRETPPVERVPTAPVALESSFTNSIGMEFVLIPAGSFTMGSPDSDAEAFDREKSAHVVTISQPFYLGKYPVTQAQWEAAMGDNPSKFTGDPNRPVEQVRWDALQGFMQKLSEQESGRDYRLPTEAQWEYACRAGTETPRYHEDVEAIAWYNKNSNRQTHPVGQKLPNVWGLYDMLGNVYEWCHDESRDYTDEAAIDPMGPTDAGAVRVIRGGSWVISTRLVRAAYRYWAHPGDRLDALGFRCSSSGRSR